MGGMTESIYENPRAKVRQSGGKERVYGGSGYRSDNGI